MPHKGFFSGWMDRRESLLCVENSIIPWIEVISGYKFIKPEVTFGYHGNLVVNEKKTLKTAEAEYYENLK